jgi:hypothetical protein
VWDSSADIIASREPLQQWRSLERIFLGFAHSFMNQTANTALSSGKRRNGRIVRVAVPATKN